MCTLTFIPTADGYVAGMNRDEKFSRPAALPPEQFNFSRSAAAYPHESSGGTWIACNIRGNLLALLNWNDVAPRLGATQMRSRGLLIPELITADTLADTEAWLAQCDLNAFPPFRLVGVFPAESVIVEWRWNGLCLERIKSGWERRHWFSSSLSDAQAQQERGRCCDRAALSDTMDLVSRIRSLHQSHDPVPGAFSVCVHRKDVASVSYTEVCCAGESVSMRYRSGSPCLTSLFDSEISLTPVSI
jgi:hypothetical protein